MTAAPDTEAEALRAQIVALFETIEKESMSDVPVLNKALSVHAVGFEPLGDFSVGVLVTPWFMNLMLIPLDAKGGALDDENVGSKRTESLPAGAFEFIVGYEEAIGKFLSCSLFSPMFEFADQDAAVQTADAVLDQILAGKEAAEIDGQEDSDDENGGGQENSEDDDWAMREIWAGRIPAQVDAAPTKPKELSRRDLLRGGRKSQSQSDQDMQSEQ